MLSLFLSLRLIDFILKSLKIKASFLNIFSSKKSFSKPKNSSGSGMQG